MSPKFTGDCIEYHERRLAEMIATTRRAEHAYWWQSFSLDGCFADLKFVDSIGNLSFPLDIAPSVSLTIALSKKI